MKQQQQAPAGGQHPDGQHGSSTFDAAVQQLKQLSDAGRLPGTFFGRLCNVAAVPAAASAAATAVNAALQEVCSLRSMLLVSNRQTAEAVVAHFRAHRVGTAHCRILSEVSASRSSTSSGGGGVVGATPLLGSVAPQQALPELPDLLQQLLGGWLLVERRQDALQLLHLRRNLVTRWAAACAAALLLMTACLLPAAASSQHHSLVTTCCLLRATCPRLPANHAAQGW